MPDTPPPRGAIARLIGGRHAELRQAARVMVGAGAAFVAYKLLGFEQGYWAVFTVVIVLQGSIGGTLGAAVDRLIGTVAGAVLGALALILAPPTTMGIALALGVVTGITALAAAVRPQLRVAPVTAAIVLLSHVPGVSPERFALDRVLEIALGGVIGVLTSLFVFPARSRGVVVARISSALTQCAQLLHGAAEAFDGTGESPGAAAHAPLRKALIAIEAAMQDAERERQSRLGEHGIPPAVPRTLWRIRNDIVHVTRGLEDPLPEPVAQAFGPIAAGLLRAEAAYAERCRLALGESRAVERGDAAERYAAFAAGVEALRQSQVTRGMDFAVVGRLFGLIFALEQLHRNLNDLADRIDEAAAAPARRALFART
ncbi:MAG: FUSC family protein [Pseudomonadota bacterium]